jgi:hypothetical protein
VPAGRQYGLHLLRLLIDALVPRKSSLLAEGGHGLDQLIDLRIEQMLPIAGLQIFNLIRRRTRVPILNCDDIGRSVNRQAQVIGLARQHEVERIDGRPKEQPVLIA